jgi:hypothetical protein
MRLKGDLRQGPAREQSINHAEADNERVSKRPLGFGPER